MTYLGHHVTLTWGQILTLNFQGKNIFFEATEGEKHDSVIANSSSLVVQKLLVKKVVSQNSYFHNVWPMEA